MLALWHQLKQFTFESDGCAVAPANSRWMLTIHLGAQTFEKRYRRVRATFAFEKSGGNFQ